MVLAHGLTGIFVRNGRKMNRKLFIAPALVALTILLVIILICSLGYHSNSPEYQLERGPGGGSSAETATTNDTKTTSTTTEDTITASSQGK